MSSQAPRLTAGSQPLLGSPLVQPFIRELSFETAELAVVSFEFGKVNLNLTAVVGL